MSERSNSRLRLAVLVLAVLNVLFLVFIQFSDSDRAAARRIEQLQINPERIKVMGAATRGSGGVAPNPASIRACMQWGPLTIATVSAADAALGELNLAQPAVQRRLQNDHYAYLLREPDAATIAKVAELQRNYPGTELKAVPCPL